MYTIQKQNKFEDTIQLQNQDGSMAQEIHFEINDMLGMLKKFRETNLAYVKAQQAIEQDPENPQAIEQVGQCIIKLMQGLFGDENTAKLLSFYENNYETMLSDIMPYVYQVLIPAMQRVAKSSVKRLKNPKSWVK